MISVQKNLSTTITSFISTAFYLKKVISQHFLKALINQFILQTMLCKNQFNT